MNRNTTLIVVLAIAAFGARLGVATRQGLHADEIFSLAMATGHSVEHSMSKARPELGDFTQGMGPPSRYRQYTQHDELPAGFGRVTRAVFLSDTNPPLYYHILHVWTRMWGTSDLALRLLSILLSTACLPLAFLLGRHLFGKRTGLISATLLAFAPQSVFHGSSGRMYSLLTLLILATALLTLQLHRSPSRRATAGWIVCSAAGLLTHYFYVMAWGGMFAWLLLYPHRLSRTKLLALAAAAITLVMPWYLGLPESMEGWRVTKGWLDRRPEEFSAPLAHARILVQYFLTSGDWMNRKGMTDYLILGLLGSVAVYALARLRHLIRLRSVHLLLLWIAGSSFGLLLFDVVQNSYARQHSRYAFVALPGALLLLAAIIARLPAVPRAVTLAALIILWGQGILRLEVEHRTDGSFRVAAPAINASEMTRRVVIIHGVPTTAIGYARYVDDRALMMDWVTAHRRPTAEKDAAYLASWANRVTIVTPGVTSVIPYERFFLRRAESVHRVAGLGYEIRDFTLRQQGSSR